jgi:peptidoglycan/xylan/chitin deacetylase (PgdA/CDA1 family)
LMKTKAETSFVNTTAGVLYRMAALRYARKGTLAILIYHRVLPRPDPMLGEEVDAKLFRQHLTFLKTNCNVLPLTEAVSRLRNGQLPPRAACITFDDGYADNYHVARPLLQEFGLSATFFVSTGYLDGGRMWNDTIIEAIRNATAPLVIKDIGRFSIDTTEARQKAAAAVLTSLKHLPFEMRQHRAEEIAGKIGGKLPGDLMMTRAEVRALHGAGMIVGAHTVTHPILSRTDDVVARKEIADGREDLEGLTGGRVTLFAYPNGRPVRDYTAAHVQLVRELGFDAAVSTAWGIARRDSDLYQLPRFTPWDRDPLRFVVRFVQNYRRGPSARV